MIQMDVSKITFDFENNLSLFCMSAIFSFELKLTKSYALMDLSDKWVNAKA
jgi:hypothetical protein